jgi:hypothetical protein
MTFFCTPIGLVIHSSAHLALIATMDVRVPLLGGHVKGNELLKELNNDGPGRRASLAQIAGSRDVGAVPAARQADPSSLTEDELAEARRRCGDRS